tara:strand:- start:95 stop:379 length:285 start_codon:yes stop_codon:yes gene_type:complete
VLEVAFVADRNMMLTVDEYMALRRLIESERESEGAEVVQDKPKRRPRGNKKNDAKMSKALAQANQELRKVNGDLRKGVTQGDIMSRAHRIRKTL